MTLDPLVDFDWRLHWKRLVEEREGFIGGPRQTDFWQKRAATYQRSVVTKADPLLDLLGGYASASKSLIDVGAGTGRHAGPMAARMEWVTAVEPSEAMRSHIPVLPNLTVIASNWEDADPAPADLVICNHVLYPIPEPVPFIEKMERSALERVFICMRDQPNRHPAELLRQELTGAARAREPRFQDLFNLLRWMGIAPEVTYRAYPSQAVFESLEVALDDLRGRIGAAWDEARARAWLEERMVAEPDGGVCFDSGEMTAGIAHWQPRR